MKSKRIVVLFVLIALFILSFVALLGDLLERRAITGNIINVDYSNNTFFEFDKRNSTLVLYNENYLFGQEIANYYANARGISLNRTCGVRMPPGTYISGEQFRAAKNEIIEKCLCRVLNETLPLAQRPNPCNVTNINLITNLSPITHLVFTKGMPSRLYNTGWSADAERPPADYYMSVLLLSNRDMSSMNFGSDGEVFNFNFGRKPYQGSFLAAPYYQTTSSITGYARALNASMDRMLAFGRIEAVDVNRTKELIVRTIAAENRGIYGNFLVNIPGSQNNARDEIRYRFLSELASNDATFCDAYIINSSLTWNYTYCRSGAILDGNVAGENANLYTGNYTRNGVPDVYNVGFYLGNDAGPNGHQGFDGFWGMLNWKINQSSCTTLCKDLPTQIERDICRANSKDFARSINTACVSASSNLIGWQLRSYPVTFYGDWPAGWSPLTGNGGTVPEVMTGNAYVDSRYADDKFVRFRSENFVNNPLCFNLSKSLVPCNEKLHIAFEHYHRLYFYNANAGVNNSFILRYKSDPINNGKKFSIYYWIAFANTTTGQYLKSYSKTITINSDGNNWTSERIDGYLSRSEILVNGSNIELQGAYAQVYADIIENLTGYIDFDTIDIIDNNRSLSLFSVETASFNHTDLLQTVYGDYAINAIDRLGGIGWWGSSSHFLTGGYAYSSSDRFIGAFFSGRTLGESLSYTGSEFSGLVYADPLYNPAGVKIYLNPRAINGFIPQINTGKQLLSQNENIYPPYLFGEQFNNTNATIQINAFNGKARNSTTRWSLSQCNLDKYSCMSFAGAWREIANGNGSAYGLNLPLGLKDLINSNYSNQTITLRLRVWNIGDEINDLTNYAAFRYIPSTIVGNKIIGNITKYRGYPELEKNLPIIYLDGDGYFDQDSQLNRNASVSFRHNGVLIFNLTHDFSLSDLNLSLLNISIGNPSNNYVIVEGVNTSDNDEKILYVAKYGADNFVCFANQNFVNSIDLVNKCTNLACPFDNSGVSCRIENGQFVLKGLTNLGAIQKEFGNYIVGNISKFRNGNSNPIIQLDNNLNFDQNQLLKEKRNISFYFNGSIVINFTHDFLLSPLNLTNLEIIIERSPINYMIINNLDIQSKKSIYLPDVNNNDALCYVDGEVDDIGELIEDCIDINCPDNENGISCRQVGSNYILNGFSHSAVLQHNYPVNNTNTSTVNNTKTNPSSGGGAGPEIVVNVNNSESNNFSNSDNEYPTDYVPAEEPNQEIEMPSDNSEESSSGSNFMVLLIILFICILLVSAIIILIVMKKKKSSSGDINIRMLHDYVNQGLYELEKGNFLGARELYQKVISMYSYYKINNLELKTKIENFSSEINKHQY